MEFLSRRSTNASSLGVIGAHGGRLGSGRYQDVKNRRPSPLTMYEDPPSRDISLEDFENLAVERLKVLCATENASFSEDSYDKVLRRLQEAIRDTHLDVRTEEDLELDNFSHWILRLAFAANDDLRKRFLAFEVLLFKLRFEKRLDMQEIQTFMKANNMRYHPIDKAEFEKHAHALRDVYMANNHIRSIQASSFGNSKAPESGFGNATSNIGVSRPADSTQYYKVKFTEVPELVARRQVLIRDGMAFVPEHDLLTILTNRFRSKISQKLAIAFRSLPYVLGDDRLKAVIKLLETAYVGPEYGFKARNENSNRDIRAETLDSYVVNMPLCMQELYMSMKKDHHLKYYGRLQFQLFLKGIGLSMGDCMRFFQTEFTKKPMSADDFKKRYSYNIRHAYGQEGKRADYRPFDCTKIVTGIQPTNSDEHHGCPFKTFNKAILRRTLTKRCNADNRYIVDEIMDKVEQKQYGLACKRHFELLHPGGDTRNLGNHPNVWFDQSVAYFESKSATSKQ